MTRPLSPAAQALRDAVHAAIEADLNRSPHYPDPLINADLVAASAARAAADAVVPETLGLMHPAARSETEAIRRELLAIANELDPRP